MTILTTHAYYAPDIAEILDEAFERAGLAPSTIGNDHIDSALRSIKYQLNSEWLTLGIRQWSVDNLSHTISAVGEDTFICPAGVIDVIGAILSRDNRDTPMHRFSRNDYLELPNKTDTGRPDRYFTDRHYDHVHFHYWRAAENTTDVINYNAFRQSANAGSDASHTLEMPPHAQEAFVAGLAARVAMKHNIERYALLQTYYRGTNPEKIGGVLKLACDEDRERADLRLSIGHTRYGRT